MHIPISSSTELVWPDPECSGVLDDSVGLDDSVEPEVFFDPGNRFSDGGIYQRRSFDVANFADEGVCDEKRSVVVFFQLPIRMAISLDQLRLVLPDLTELFRRHGSWSELMQTDANLRQASIFGLIVEAFANELT